MLKKTSSKFDFKYSFFGEHIVWYFLSVFFFSRFFYVISQWNDLKYIKNPLEFFVMGDYFFSLFGAIFGFLLVFLINIKLQEKKVEKYIDGLVLSFLLVVSLGFIGTLFGGQVYGIETHFGIEILYTHPFTQVPYKVPVFPLPIVYSILFFLLFSVLYTSHIFLNIKGLIGYVGAIIFASIILIFEVFSGKYDAIKDSDYNIIGINFPQIFAIIIIAVAGYRLYKIFKIDLLDKKVAKK